MRADRLFRQKTAAATKVQTLYRMKVARRLVHQVRLQTNALKCQRHLRGYLARKEALALRDYKCKVVAIQRHYKRRFRMTKRSATTVQRILRGYLYNRKVARLQRVWRGGQTLLAARQRFDQRHAVQTLRIHASVIRVQSFLRMRTQRRAYLQQLRSCAQEKIRSLFRLRTLTQVRATARLLHAERDLKARLVQKYLRGVQAAMRLKKMRLTALQDRHAHVIQRYAKGYLGFKQAKM